MADYLSRYSLGKEDISNVDIPRPYASSRSLYTVEAGLETRDPLVPTISEEGMNDEDYKLMVHNLINNIPAKNVEGELKVMNSLRNFLSEEELPNGKSVILKDGSEILVPKSLCKQMVANLHYTQMAPESMLYMVKGSFFWPGLKQDLYPNV